MVGAGRNLSHCLIQCSKYTFQGFLDCLEISCIILLCVLRQISFGDGAQHVGYFADVSAEIMYGIFEDFAQETNLIIRTDADLNLSTIGQTKFSFFKM